MKLKLFLIIAIISFNANSKDMREAKTMAKCSYLALALELDSASIMFTDAYKKLYNLSKVDQLFYDQINFTEGMVAGYAAAKNEEMSTVEKNFYYTVCKGTTFKYAEDLTK